MAENNYEQPKRKGDTVLLTVIAIATLLVAIVGATFAYFTASVSGNSSASSVIINTASLGTVTFASGNTITLSNALPGATSEVLTFTVKVEDNTEAIAYDITWTDVTNELDEDTESQMVYTLTGTSTNGGTVVEKSGATCPYYSSGVLTAYEIGTGSLAANGDKHSYELTVHFVETGTSQDVNQGKTFSGAINVGTSGADTVYYNNENSTGTTTEPAAE